MWAELGAAEQAAERNAGKLNFRRHSDAFEASFSRWRLAYRS